MIKLIFFWLLISIPFIASAQPGTEIYLFDLKIKGEKVIISNPRNITNRKGYDNQPFFHPDKPLLYFVSANDEGRTDIVGYDYKKSVAKKLTQTHDREYSPTVTPDKRFISCILQRDSGQQDLVKYPIEGGEPHVIISNQIIGYHTWADVNTVAVFTLPQPFKLHLIDVTENKDTVIAEQIGRSLHKIPRQNAISFVQKIKDDEWSVSRFDRGTKTVSVITNSLPGAEHHMTWAPDGKIIMSDDKKLFFFHPGTSKAWAEVEFNSSMSINTLTRIAVSPDGKTLAVVVNE